MFHIYHVHQGEDRALALLASYPTYQQAVLADLDHWRFTVPATVVSEDSLERFNSSDARAERRAASDWAHASQADWANI